MRWIAPIIRHMHSWDTSHASSAFTGRRPEPLARAPCAPGGTARHPRRETLFLESTRHEPSAGAVTSDVRRSPPRSHWARLRAHGAGRTRAARAGIADASVGGHGARRRIRSCEKPGTFSRGHDGPRSDGAHAAPHGAYTDYRHQRTSRRVRLE